MGYRWLVRCRSRGSRRILPLVMVAAVAVAGCSDASLPPVPKTVRVFVEPHKLVFVYPNGVESVALHMARKKPILLTMPWNGRLKNLSIPGVSVTGAQWNHHPALRVLAPARIETRVSYAVGAARQFRTRCYVLKAHALRRWLRAKNRPYVDNHGRLLPLPVVGHELAQSFSCVLCHSGNGVVNSGPTWKNVAGSTVVLANGKKVIANYAYLRHAILHPGNKMVRGFKNLMPHFGDQLGGPGHSPRRLDALIAYINSLSKYRNKASEPPITGAP